MVLLSDSRLSNARVQPRSAEPSPIHLGLAQPAYPDATGAEVVLGVGPGVAKEREKERFLQLKPTRTSGKRAVVTAAGAVEYYSSTERCDGGMRSTFLSV